MKLLRILSTTLASLPLAFGLTVQAAELTQWETYTPGEEEEARLVAEELMAQVKKDYVDVNKRAFRDAHPRGIGCVAASFTVDPKLPVQYQSGVFATPGKSYDALIRFSSSLGPASDQDRDARGMAIKLLGVDGPKLLADQADAVTHDFLMINSPTFPTKNARDFAGIVSLKTNPANIVKFLKEAPITRALELKALLNDTINNPYNGKSLLVTRFFSQVPYLFQSPKITAPVKFSARPCTAAGERKLDGSESELRNDLQAYLNENDACFEFSLQFYKEGAGFEVENGMSEWKESKSPFIRFATVTIPKQNFMTDERLHYCDNLSFQPWHALAEHRPIGNINRTRKIVYEILSKYRHDKNQARSQYPEPRDLGAWNSLTSKDYTDWNAIKVPADIR